VGPRAGLEEVTKRESLLTAPKTGHPARSQDTILTELSRIRQLENRRQVQYCHHDKRHVLDNSFSEQLLPHSSCGNFKDNKARPQLWNDFQS
jgi:hypothetical protein